MRILFFGDLVGEMALRYLEENLPRLRRELGVDFVVANGENADLTDPALGKAGMHPETVERLLACGVDAITGGNHSFDPPGRRRFWTTPGSCAP